MKQQLQQRLQELETEFQSGQQVLAELETKKANLQDTLLRIEGAIQVLKEELAKTENTESDTSLDALDGKPAEMVTNSHD
ncbi:hypothetical protein [Pleurocapsa sp. PCC 7319]|uniref:hypothetical protein n=1 Tax=Pleurocapsa sp. PCC 7319 TaxID=118161 RepID=UPI00034D527B|nr:hypothetical protein [Pleurocapsa sp. PCC 7319]